MYNVILSEAGHFSFIGLKTSIFHTLADTNGGNQSNHIRMVSDNRALAHLFGDSHYCGNRWLVDE